MRQARCLPPITLRRLLASLAAAIVVSMAISAGAQASAASDRTEQRRYARETVDLTYSRFMARKADFTRSGCNPDDRAAGDYCRKPRPYNRFDWTTDGCSGFPVVSAWYRGLFRRPCELHDFGYRNFGKGLTLQRDEDTRSWIDDRFETEMVRLCNYHFARWWQKANKVTCVEQAGLVWGAVRNLSHWSPPEAGVSAPTVSPLIDPLPDPGFELLTPLEPVPTGWAPTPSVGLARGPAAPAGYRYAITLSGFAAGASVSITCHDSVDPGGFYSFSLTTDGVGAASTAAWCYSGDGPDHWVVAGGVQSNHVAWGGAAPAPPPPPPPAATYSETTGGVAHTWTNHTNAGGTQGPSIPANATVQIACRITGFRVADGNTWWYRIASSPWSGAFYVSADAFYNNGQTSGSLVGTPFVDPSVRDC